MGLLDLMLDEPLTSGAWHEHFRALRADLATAEVGMLGAPVPVLIDYEEIRAFFGDHELYPGGALYAAALDPTIGRTFISMDGAEHHRYRQLATPAFRSRPATAFVEHQMVPLAHEIVDRFAARGTADLVSEFTEVLPFWSISRKVGFPVGSEEEQRSVARDLITGAMTPEVARAAAERVTALVGDVLEERRAHPGDDVLSHLLTAEVDGRGMTNEDVLAHVRLLYAVGATTTADAMSNLLHHLLSRPDLVQRAVADPALRPRIVHEALRYEPPVAAIPRILPHGGRVAGRDVAPGSMVMVALAAANRDPGVFADPEAFDVDREEKMLLSFGYGAKFCPGSHFGRRQLLAALDVLLARLPGLQLEESSGPVGNVLRSTQRLAVTWRA